MSDSPLLVVSRLLMTVVATGAMLLGGAETALGCSCVIPDAQALLAEAEAAFVGTLIEAPPDRGAGSSADLVPWVFEVEAAYKGEITTPMTVLSPISSASCGLSMAQGDRASLFVNRQDDHWQGNLCATMGPEALLDGRVDPIPFAETQRGSTTTARWALATVAVVGLGALATTWVKHRHAPRQD